MRPTDVRALVADRERARAERTPAVHKALGTSGSAELWIYEEIDAMGWWGISATMVAEAVASLGPVTEITVRLNSPGGDVWDGIAIHNILRNHAASIHVVVDGLAASVASVIAMAGDTITMGTGAQMMIHDPWAYLAGNAAELRAYADQLDGVADNLAGIYQERAGGDVAAWRAVMVAETWFTGAEAVEAGLADDTAPSRSAESDTTAAALSRDWDLAARFTYAGRDKAPAPPPRPTRQAAASTRRGTVATLLRAAVAEAAREAVR